MARKKSQSFSSDADPVSAYMANLKLKDLKRNCIIRGMPFMRVTRVDVNGLQSWLYRNFSNRINPQLLEDFDKWRDDILDDSPVPLELRMAFFGELDGKVKQERRNTQMLGMTKTKSEIANFKPRRGSMKSLVFELVRQGKTTKEVIEEVMDQYDEAKEGSIKSWCSKARKSVKAQEELENE